MVQVEYSPWTLEIERPSGTHLMQTARELGVSIFAYSPLSNGIMTGRYKSPNDFGADGYRRLASRWQSTIFTKSLVLVEKFKELAAQKEWGS